MSERDEPVTDQVVSLKLDHLQTTMDEVKKDVKEIKDESPVLRIKQLEDKWSGLVKFSMLLTVAVIGAYLTAWFTR